MLGGGLSASLPFRVKAHTPPVTETGFQDTTSGLKNWRSGYLIGFVLAAYVVGLLAERGWERSVRTSLAPFLIGTAIIYVCGVAWLTVLLGSFSKALAAGLVPFLIGDAIKLIAASLALPAAWKLVR